MKKIISFLLLLCTFSCSFVPTSFADDKSNVNYYVDENGVINYVDENGVFKNFEATSLAPPLMYNKRTGEGNNAMVIEFDNLTVGNEQIYINLEERNREYGFSGELISRLQMLWPITTDRFTVIGLNEDLYYSMFIATGKNSRKLSGKVTMTYIDPNTLGDKFVLEPLNLPENSKPAIAELSEMGIMNGDSDGNFYPEKAVTRAELAQLAYNTLPLANETMPLVIYGSNMLYSDMPTSHWAEKAVGFLREYNVISAYPDGSFHPDENITYTEAAAMLVKLLHYGEYANQNGGYPNGYMDCADKLGLTKGITLNAEDAVPRETAALMIQRALDIPILKAKSYTYGVGADFALDQNFTYRNTRQKN